MDTQPNATTAKRKTRRWEKAFLEAFALTGHVGKASEAAGIERTEVWRWRNQCSEFAAEYEVAFQNAKVLLEEEAKRRAVEGTVRYKFKRNGEPLLHPVTGDPYCEHEYSDTLLIFLLKRMDPERYRERYEHTGKDGGPIQYANLSDEELDKRITAVEARLATSQGREGATDASSESSEG